MPGSFFLFSKPNIARSPAYWCRQACRHLQHSTTTILPGAFLLYYLTCTFPWAANSPLTAWHPQCTSPPHISYTFQENRIRPITNNNFVTRKSGGGEWGSGHSMSCGTRGSATKYFNFNFASQYSGFLMICVVYFDQHMHACACVRMVENHGKPFPSCA